MDDIFKKAGRDALSKGIVGNKPITEEINIESVKAEIIKGRTESLELTATEEVIDDAADVLDGMTELEKFAHDMEHRFAKRARSAMNALPDREFIGQWFKALEYHKPKLNRQHGTNSGVSDNTIKIEIVRTSEDLNK